MILLIDPTQGNSLVGINDNIRKEKLRENVNEILFHTHKPITLDTLTQRYTTKEDFGLKYPHIYHCLKNLNLKICQLPYNSLPYIYLHRLKNS